MSPEQIFTALDSGAMSLQGAQLNPQERRAVAEFLSGKSFGADTSMTISKAAFCGDSGKSLQNTLSGPAWNGWGVTITNTRFQHAEMAGISSQDVPQLKLKWAFGFPGDSSASAQPVVLGGRVYVGSWGGKI